MEARPPGKEGDDMNSSLLLLPTAPSRPGEPLETRRGAVDVDRRPSSRRGRDVVVCRARPGRTALGFDVRGNRVRGSAKRKLEVGGPVDLCWIRCEVARPAVDESEGRRSKRRGRQVASLPTSAGSFPPSTFSDLLAPLSVKTATRRPETGPGNRPKNEGEKVRGARGPKGSRGRGRKGRRSAPSPTLVLCPPPRTPRPRRQRYGVQGAEPGQAS